MEVLEADKQIAFVQTKRVPSMDGMNLFQKYVAFHEEGGVITLTSKDVRF